MSSSLPEDGHLREFAHEILSGFLDSLGPLKRSIFKGYLAKLQQRFEVDQIDEEAFAYIVTALLRDQNFLSDDFNCESVLSSELRLKADIILAKIRDKLNSRLTRVLTSWYHEEDLLNGFAIRLEERQFERIQAVPLLQIMWDELQ